MEKLVPRLRFPGFEGEWEEKKLGDITTWASGGTPPKDESQYWNGNIPWISASTMRGLEYSDSSLKLSLAGVKKGSKIAKENSLLLLVRGSMLFKKIPVGIVTKDVSFNQDVKSIVVENESATSKYLLSWFIANEPLLLEMVTGTGIGAGKLDLAELKNLDILLPSIAEQTKISVLITSVENRIETLKKKKTLLEQYKKGIKQQIFNQEVRFKDEDGKDFGAWEEKTISELATIIGGGTPETGNDEYWNGNIQWFTPTEIKDKYTAKSIRTITPLGLKKSSAKLLPTGTLLLTTRATIGEVSISTEECATNQGFQSLVSKSGNNNVFLYNWITLNKYQLVQRANGSTFPEISKSEIEKIPLSVPGYEEQTKIANFLSAIDDKIGLVGKEIEGMERWKKGLLEEMFV